MKSIQLHFDDLGECIGLYRGNGNFEEPSAILPEEIGSFASGHPYVFFRGRLYQLTTEDCDSAKEVHILEYRQTRSILETFVENVTSFFEPSLEKLDNFLDP